LCRNNRFTVIAGGNGKTTTMKGLVDDAMNKLAAVDPASNVAYAS
jgi:hypothetical protein